jgi:hypothetical protein
VKHLLQGAALLAALGTSTAHGAPLPQTILDNTLVRVFSGNSPASVDALPLDDQGARDAVPWADIIAFGGPTNSRSPFETFQATITRKDANTVSWEIRTNMQREFQEGAGVADLFISLKSNDTWDRVITLRNRDPNPDVTGVLGGTNPEVLEITSPNDYLTSRQLWGVQSYGYGGQWSNCASEPNQPFKATPEQAATCDLTAKDVPTVARRTTPNSPDPLTTPLTVTPLQIVDFKWLEAIENVENPDDPNTPPKYGDGTSDGSGKITFDIVGAGADWDDFTWIWGTADCANDTIHGRFAADVPEPSTLMLLGVAGVFALARRRRQRGRAL